ncbi:MAG TPA: LysM peptidoglycan-binding domain-containing M23 family metallopeptidase [Myxococcota bacterium]
MTRARRPRAAALVAVLAGLLALACVSPGDSSAPRDTTAVHVVRAGENLYRIALHYGVSVDALMRANGIRDPHALELGTRLVIPHARHSAPPREPLARELDADAQRLALGWPVHGIVTSGFGSRSGRPHEGLDISAHVGAPIWAAAAGVVTFSGRLGDYGNLVVIRHDALYATAYAHNNRNFVRKGEHVERGQRIADVGKSGNARGNHPHLHFEVRRAEVQRDPLRYLP